ARGRILSPCHNQCQSPPSQQQLGKELMSPAAVAKISPRPSFKCHCPHTLMSQLKQLGWIEASSRVNMPGGGCLEDEVYYTLSFNSLGSTKRRGTYMITIRQDLKTISINDANLKWFTTDLRSSHANTLDVRFSIESKKTHQKDSEVYLEYISSPDIIQPRQHYDPNTQTPFTLNRKIKDLTYLIRSHRKHVILQAPHDHPMKYFNPLAKFRETTEYTNEGTLYNSKLELEISMDMPREEELVTFINQYWDLGVSFINKLPTSD
ncbi:hypothetical protein SAMD00019534_033200, partial [Acytostelium subglobosum LB1]|uniref:hypothetical protein n=1 Tax=Acytostelium subglobosum LB1 TaxID=1410327 RepID=UPI0006448D8B